ncbi:MAG: protein singed [Mixta calida]|uniref:protein singed n=1 Tax=Mixta calida TaxID=665913 RepID=UPI0016803E06|nr:protein singed [Mixta calida]MDU4288334.1 protein singed [Mixta calida]MDU4943810.1 protein singed [Mixta calida]QNU44385.1 protein singed [Mixta calida]
MATYITVADVDELLGADWAPAEKKAKAVLQANAYLTALNLQGIIDATPDDVKMAGAYLALTAATGMLYRQQTESGALSSKMVDADGVKVSKTYASGQTSSTSLLPDNVQLALALLQPWRSNPFAFRVYR